MEATDEATRALERTEAARRGRFLEHSREMAPGVKKEMCFYTPREVLTALDKNETILEWRRYIMEEYEPEPARYALIFPDTDRQPWTQGVTVDRAYKNLYISLRTLKLEDSTRIFTLSGILGIVPMERYPDMPIYDGSGLYSWAVRQKGLTWDLEAFRNSLDITGAFLSAFVHKHRGSFEEWHILYRRPSIHERIFEHSIDVDPFPIVVHKIKKPIASSYTLIRNSLKDMV